MSRIYLTAACVAAGLAFAGPAWASAGDAGCAVPPHRTQLVCSSDACLRLETQFLCEQATRRRPARSRPAVRPISREERSARALDRLIASID